MLTRTLLLALMAGSVTLAGWAATKGPDGGGYTGTDETVYSFVDLALAGGVSVLAGADDGLAALTLPFTFRFYGQPYTVVCVSSNGAVYFVAGAGACSGFTDFANTDLSAAPVPNDFPALLPLWTDLTFEQAGSGAVLYGSAGAAGSRRFIVQWNDAYPQGSPNPVTFQAVLSEGTNDIRFQYRAIGLGPGNPAGRGGQATVGIRNAGAPASGQQIAWSYNAPVIADQSALLFSAAPAPSCAQHVNGSVSVARQGYLYNPVTRRFSQTVRVTNTSAAAIAGPFALVLDDLSANATLFNATGTTSCATPAGRPFVANAAASLAPGATLSFVLQFTNPTRQTISYNTRVLAGDAAR
jgi:hypothetical protein